MLQQIKGEQPFQVLNNAFSISPSNEGYQLQISSDGFNYSTLFSVGAGVTRLVTGVAAGSYYRLLGNDSDIVINWRKSCGEGGGGGGEYILPIASSNTLGGVMIGSGITIDSEGHISAQGGGSGDMDKLLAVSELPASAADGTVMALITQTGVNPPVPTQDSPVYRYTPYTGDDFQTVEITDTISPMIFIENMVGWFAVYDQNYEPYQLSSTAWTDAIVNDVVVAHLLFDGTYLWVGSTGAETLQWSDMTNVVEAGESETTYGIYQYQGSAWTLTDEEYVLPPATQSTLGGIKVGSGLTITEDGTLSANGGGSADMDKLIPVSELPSSATVGTLMSLYKENYPKVTAKAVYTISLAELIALPDMLEVLKYDNAEHTSYGGIGNFMGDGIIPEPQWYDGNFTPLENFIAWTAEGNGQIELYFDGTNVFIADHTDFGLRFWCLDRVLDLATVEQTVGPNPLYAIGENASGTTYANLVTSESVYKMLPITQAAYNALVSGGTADPNTLYIIVNE